MTTSSPSTASQAERGVTRSSEASLDVHLSPHSALAAKVLQPAEHFYWIKLSVPEGVAPAARYLHSRYQRAIAEQLAAEALPSLDDLEWIATPVGTSHVLVCLQERAQVSAVQSTGALYYGPAAIPSELSGEVRLSTINFLVGSFAPPRVVRAWRSVSLAASAMIIIMGALLAWGLELRAVAARQEAATIGQQVATVVRAEGQASLTALQSERQRLTQTRQRLADRGQADAGLALAALTQAWPSGITAPVVMTETVSITADQMVLQCSAMTREDATRLAERLASFPHLAMMGANAELPDQWQLEQPQIATAQGGQSGYRYRITLRLVRNSAGDTR